MAAILSRGRWVKPFISEKTCFNANTLNCKELDSIANDTVEFVKYAIVILLVCQAILGLMAPKLQSDSILYWRRFFAKILLNSSTILSENASFLNTFNLQVSSSLKRNYDDVIKWKYFPRYWPFVRGIHRGPVNSPHIGQWRGALMFSLICTRINGWVNNAYWSAKCVLLLHCYILLEISLLLLPTYLLTTTTCTKIIKVETNLLLCSTLTDAIQTI